MNTTNTQHLVLFYDTSTNTNTLLDAVTQYGSTLLCPQHNMPKGLAISVPQHKTLEEAERHFYRVAGVQLIQRVNAWH